MLAHQTLNGVTTYRYQDDTRHQQQRLSYQNLQDKLRIDVDLSVVKDRKDPTTKHIQIHVRIKVCLYKNQTTSDHRKLNGVSKELGHSTQSRPTSLRS